MLRRPHFTAFYQGSWQQQHWQLNLELNYQGERSDTGGLLPSYTLANAAVNYQWSEDLALRVKLNNLLDKDYLQGIGFMGPEQDAYVATGRQILVGLDYRF